MSAMPLEIDPADWQADALAWIEAFAASGVEFSADDLRDKLPAPHHPSAWGAAFRVAKGQGLLVEVAYRPSRTRSRRFGRSVRWVGNPEHFGKAAS